TDARASRRYRRPSGEPPPLPRDLRPSGLLWAALGGAVVVLWIGLFLTGRGPRADLIDQPILQAFESIRTGWLTRIMRWIQKLGSDTTVVVLAWTGILVALVFRRYRHAAVFLGCIILTTWITTTMSLVFTRPRPEGIAILGSWHGFSHPSRPVSGLALCLVGLTYMLVPQGKWRVARGEQIDEAESGVSRATWVIFGCVVALGVARMYLAVDHPTDVLFGAILGIAIPVVAFRTLVPAEVFPITYRRGRAAHLDISGRRGEAMVQALREQLGLEVLDIQYHGLEGSGGSTPLRIRASAESSSGAGSPITASDDGAEKVLFGKLYAANHLRADRWYKLGRTLLYGRLEDEFAFSTVRRLVQYEDYLLRLMHSAGLPSPEPYGFVEITPEREYLIVTEFFLGAAEIGDVKVDEQVIDDALHLVAALWHAGLAHRDIKPSNVLVRDRAGGGREVLLIDVAFAEVRPSPWRQAVDLANMMLVLALCSGAEEVYERALRRFTAEDIAEAFAATRGVTMPTQLRAYLRQDGRDLLGRFRKLTGNPPPVRIQRWSLRRIALLGVVLLGGLLALGLVVNTMLNLRLLGFPIQLPLSRSVFLG
ncbi:MAG: phosphatase PAP2 family protein, partial [Actinomycetota bacterium]|nr:phosphatase PAP2 family protein [Actinomycetota bacterium]